MTTETDTEKMAQALRDILDATDGYVPNTSKVIWRNAQAALAAHDSRAQPASVPHYDPYRECAGSATGLVTEKPAPHAAAPTSPSRTVKMSTAQPASVADRYRQIGWVHPVYLDQHMGAGALAIEVSQPRLSDAQIPVFVRAAAPQSPAIGHVGKSHKEG